MFGERLVSGTQLMEKVLFRFAKQWIAGNTIENALESAKTAYDNGRHAIINKLGEYHTEQKPIQESLSEYNKIISSFRGWQVRGAISIKPTQLGQSIFAKC